MQKRALKILGLVLIVVGVIMLLDFPRITGFSVFKNLSRSIREILGLIFVLVSVVLFIGSKTLEQILAKKGKDLNKIIQDRERFVETHYKGYKRFLKKEKKIPENYKTEEEKENYAKKELRDKFNPLVQYDDKDSIEYLEVFRESPRSQRVPIPGDAGTPFPVKVNYKISDPLLINLTEKASKNERLWKGARQKIYRLSEGNLGPLGQGYNFVEDTGNRYIYLKHTSGARVFLEKVSEKEYNLVGITSGEQTKKYESRAIEKCKDLVKAKKAKKTTNQPA